MDWPSERGPRLVDARPDFRRDGEFLVAHQNSSDLIGLGEKTAVPVARTGSTIHPRKSLRLTGASGNVPLKVTVPSGRVMVPVKPTAVAVMRPMPALITFSGGTSSEKVP